MYHIKKIKLVFFSTLFIIVVIVAGYVSVSYIFAQTQPIYYCSSQTASGIRYFGCSTDPLFSVLPSNYASNCEISADDPSCQSKTVANVINTFLGNHYCSPQGWSYYPSAGNPSTSFQCSAPTPPSGVFDFLLSNAGDKSVNQGQSTTNIVTVTKTFTSAPPSLVTFSAYELPPESTASFSPASCTPSGPTTMVCTTTMTISTDPSTPSGSYPIIVVGSSEAPYPGFPNQSTMATGHSAGVTISFYGTISIKNQYPNTAVFTRTAFSPIYQESAPTSFSIPANTTLAKSGFGNLVYYNSNVVVPGGVYGPGNGSATYSVTVNGVVVDTVTYSWDYPI